MQFAFEMLVVTMFVIWLVIRVEISNLACPSQQQLLFPLNYLSCSNLSISRVRENLCLKGEAFANGVAAQITGATRGSIYKLSKKRRIGGTVSACKRDSNLSLSPPPPPPPSALPPSPPPPPPSPSLGSILFVTQFTLKVPTFTGGRERAASV